VSGSHAAQVEAGDRFAFGENWRLFLQALTEARITEAERSLQHMLEPSSLEGQSFLDVGCGSGLFSLAAKRLGARVHSFDYDPKSVACALELRRRFFPADARWTVEEGSALDPTFLATLGQFDVVYSWGVLHHTGAMWAALDNLRPLVAPGGRLYIAIYHDTGRSSRRWLRIKRLYNRLPLLLRPLVLACSFCALWGPVFLRDLLRGRPFATWSGYGGTRGMSPWRDLVDWVGGYPYEFAKPEEIFEFYKDRGFTLAKMKTCNGNGCDEFVFVRAKAVS
jgi:2-polyprenyl-6-hydroxyphenyl methylase/3-demethylubiquinone-9 3-methyltransferase